MESERIFQGGARYCIATKWTFDRLLNLSGRFGVYTRVASIKPISFDSTPRCSSSGRSISSNKLRRSGQGSPQLPLPTLVH